MVKEDSNRTTQLNFSLRFKLLTGFTVLFMISFAVAFGWFYRFSTDRAKERLVKELVDAAEGTALSVDTDELLELHENGLRNEGGSSDHPLYASQERWLLQANNLVTNAYPYSYLVSDDLSLRAKSGEGELSTVGELTPDCDQPYRIVYLVDSLWQLNPSRALPFLLADCPSDESVAALVEGETQVRPLYQDDWGSWISAYTPIRDDEGQIVAIMGTDIEADYVYAIQVRIRNQLILAYGITYVVLFALVYLTSTYLTNPLKQLKLTAESIGEGVYDKTLLNKLAAAKFSDEISILSDVFSLMIDKVRFREESLKSEIRELKIEIDNERRHREVSEVVETDFFKELQAKARNLRQSFKDDLATDTFSSEET